MTFGTLDNAIRIVNWHPVLDVFYYVVNERDADNMYTKRTFRCSFGDSISISDMIYTGMSAEGNRVLSNHFFLFL